MDLKKLPIIGAVITALLSTLCCLPAFLFIFFGISGGFLTYFSSLEIIRVPLAILTIFLLYIGYKKSFSKELTCACKTSKIKMIIISILLFLLFVFLLFYPEIVPLFME